MDDKNIDRKRFPLVLLVCDSNPFSIVRYIERAFYAVANTVVVHLDVHEWFLKSLGLPRLFYKLFKLRLKHIPILSRDPDLVFVVEPPIKTHLDLKGFAGSPKAFYALDPHTPNAREGYMKCGVPQYDYVFCGQKNRISMLEELGGEKVYWLPYAVDPTVFRELKNVPIKYDVAFIAGLSPDRRRVVEPLMKKFKILTRGYGRGGYFMHDNSIAYSMSKIILEISRWGGLGPRPFEGMACKRLVVANLANNGIDRLFKDGSIVLYKNPQELEEKLQFYLANEDIRNRIALQGYEDVSRKHTYLRRIEEVFRMTHVRTPSSLGQ